MEICLFDGATVDICGIMSKMSNTIYKDIMDRITILIQGRLCKDNNLYNKDRLINKYILWILNRNIVWKEDWKQSKNFK